MDDIMNIPSCLINSKTAPVPASRAKRKKKLAPPKSKKWQGAELFDLSFGSEAWPIGSGRRLVWVKVGRSWVHLAEAFAPYRKKIRKSVWENILRARNNRERGVAI